MESPETSEEKSCKQGQNQPLEVQIKQKLEHPYKMYYLMAKKLVKRIRLTQPLTRRKQTRSLPPFQSHSGNRGNMPATTKQNRRSPLQH